MGIAGSELVGRWIDQVWAVHRYQDGRPQGTRAVQLECSLLHGNKMPVVSCLAEVVSTGHRLTRNARHPAKKERIYGLKKAKRSMALKNKRFQPLIQIKTQIGVCPQFLFSASNVRLSHNYEYPVNRIRYSSRPFL